MTAAFGEAFASVVPISAIAGILFAIFLWRRVAQIQVRGGGALRSDNGREYLLEEEQRGEAEVSDDLLNFLSLGCIKIVFFVHQALLKSYRHRYS